ncbi:MAG TPA: amidohydrolase family protein [Chloroflexota bacterium]|jgi:predicted TIM-barrel fold metal-dependent hydrolase
MTTAIGAQPQPTAVSTGDRLANLRAIDTDVHNDLPSYAELKPYLASAWHPWLEHGGSRFAARAYANTGSGIMDDAVRDEDHLAAGDPQWVIQQLLTKYRIDIGVMTGTMTGASIQHDPRFCSALVSAYNDWLLDKWVRPYTCFKGSINVAPQDPEAAAREIHRLGDDPGMVQVLMASAARIPYGQKYYWPIYQAAVEHNLPVAIHVGSEGTGIANPPTGVGYPSTYLEFHTDHSQTMMAHCVSVVSEGLFEQFPTLRFGFIEGGICWAPYVMWRLDRMYPALKAEVPYLSKLPSEYILSNCYFSTQPIEEPEEREHLIQMFEMLHADKTVIFASDYPHWDFDNPLTVLSFLPPHMRRRIFVDNVVDFFGPRVLQAHARA